VAQRTQPLRARPAGDDRGHPSPSALAEAEAEMAVLAEDVAAAGRVATVAHRDPQAEASRLQRLAEGVRGLRAGGGAVRLNERALLVIGGILAPLGLILVLVGWYGAARTPNLFEQIPYLISGGLFGLGLVFLGSFAYYTHWVTELVKEHRSQSAAVVEAIGRVEELLRAAPAAAAPVPLPASGASGDAEVLVATEKGTMAHRPDCVVVAGKGGLRRVAPGEDLATCKLCAF